MDKVQAEILAHIQAIHSELKAIKEEHGAMLKEHGAMLKEHGAILRALEHRSDVTGANVTRLQEDMVFLKGQFSRLHNDVTEIKEHMLDVEDGLKFALLKVAQHDSRIRQVK